MSDRIAVFNQGGSSRWVRPRRSMSGRERRSSAASSASPTCSSARAGGSRSGPRSCGCSSRARAATASWSSAAGSSTSPTRERPPAYLVELEAGGELLVVRQNLETTSKEALEQGGQEVEVGWRPEQAVPVAAKNEENPCERNAERKARPGRLDDRRLPRRAARRIRGGCGSSSSSATATPTCSRSSGKNEGELNLVEWPGYVEPQWTKPFEQKTGCKVNGKDAGTSDEMVQLMRTGQYDGVSASGNATERLVDGGNVSPVNVEPRPELQDDLLGHQGSAVQHLRRRPLRDPARPWGEPADVEPERRLAGADLLVDHPRPEGARPSTRARSRLTTTRSTSPTRRCT